jgi:hypothetical protein
MLELLVIANFYISLSAVAKPPFLLPVLEISQYHSEI